MKILQLIVVFIVTSILMTSCVSTKKFNALDADMQKTKNELNDCQTNLAKGLVSNKKLNEQVKDLQAQVDDSKTQLDAAKAAAANNNNGQLISTLKNLNILSPEQAANLDQSLKNVNASNSEQLNLTLVNNVKAAIGPNDTDIIVTSNKGFLYITLSDHMFFSSGSADLTAKGKSVMDKVAKLLNANSDIKFMVQGHTDNQPMHTACVPDNWDLSIRRATTVVRLLQKQYGINPASMMAAGHGEYEPVATNDTPAHRAQNRRITIVMMPQLDQFFKLLEKK